LLLAAALLATACGGPTAPDVIVVVTADTLRADRLGFFGSDLGLTPSLDGLAAESTVFKRAYTAAPVTLPSISALMTGRSPAEIGVRHNETVLPDSIPTLASTLKAGGWETRAVVSNFILRRDSGIDRGFDDFDDEFPQLEAVRKLPERIARDTTDAALASLDACLDPAGRRCFLWVHYQDPHGPYTPPQEFLAAELARPANPGDPNPTLPVADNHNGHGAIPNYQVVSDRRDAAFYRAAYNAEVRYLDSEIGRLLRGLSERTLDGRALVAFAADHGESLGEDDYWFAHGEFLSDALVHVPLLFRVPGRAPAERSELATLADVAVTLLAAVGSDPGSAGIPGRDLLADGASDAASSLYVSTFGTANLLRFALLEGEYKMEISEGDQIWKGRLTRIGHDEVDLTVGAPQIASALRGRLMDLREQMKQGMPPIIQELDDDEKAALSALGYVSEDAAP
jgi:choline-sulfatase